MVAPQPATLQTVLLTVLFVAGLTVIARWSRGRSTYPAGVAGLLESRWAPAIAGLITVGIVRFVWGSFSEPGVIHDERAYLLQAQIFAQGHLTAPSPPIAAFFEQMHVFIEPALFAKYPPAHALMLVPGIWLGLPGLMPAVLAGISGGLLYAIARRIANEWVAFFAWWLWTTSLANLHWSASYLSESTSMAMWLLAAWATIRWLDGQRQRDLVCIAAALAWGFHARPLTIAALSIPLVYVIGRRLIAAGSLKRLAAPVLVGAAILALGPVWNSQTLGDWRTNPYTRYSTVYFPFDKPGLGVNPAPPLRPLPPELVAVSDWSRDLHERHVLSALPVVLLQRIAAILLWVGDGWRFALVALMIAAVLRGSTVERFGALVVLVLVLSYLTFAHPPMWVAYYAEILPVLYVLAAWELGRLLYQFGRTGDDTSSRRWPASVANAAVATALLVMPLGLTDVVHARSEINRRNGFHRAARQAVQTTPPGRAIVFVRYPADHTPHLAVTQNEPDLAAAVRWVVPDRGSANGDLIRLAPDRAVYRLDTSMFVIEPLTDSVAETVSSPHIAAQYLVSAPAKTR